jgi:hypothetical protein
VLRPLVDRNGVSLHIDDDLGPSDSAERERLAAYLASVLPGSEELTGLRGDERPDLP